MNAKPPATPKPFNVDCWMCGLRRTPRVREDLRHMIGKPGIDPKKLVLLTCATCDVAE